MNAKFIPAPTRLVRFVYKANRMVKVVPMNRAQRRRLKIKVKK